MTAPNAAGASVIHVRVSVTDVWDTVELSLTPESTIAQLKAAALEKATGRSEDPADYVVKYRGALVSDEHQTLGSLGVPESAPFIVLPARRQPVR